jgi:hypothetical protein
MCFPSVLIREPPVIDVFQAETPFIREKWYNSGIKSV